MSANELTASSRVLFSGANWKAEMCEFGTKRMRAVRIALIPEAYGDYDVDGTTLAPMATLISPSDCEPQNHADREQKTRPSRRFLLGYLSNRHSASR